MLIRWEGCKKLGSVGPWSSDHVGQEKVTRNGGYLHMLRPKNCILYYKEYTTSFIIQKTVFGA